MHWMIGGREVKEEEEVEFQLDFAESQLERISASRGGRGRGDKCT